MPTILVIDDEEDILDLLTFNLERAENTVLRASDGNDGVKSATDHIPDLIVLDLMLPGRDGYQVFEALKADTRTKHIPILMLTARVNWQDKVEGLNAGADDYLVKPFQKEELVARLDALVRRSAGFVKPQITSGALEIDLAAKQVSLNSDPMEVTAFEYLILEYLMRHCHEVVAKQRLLDVIYGDKEGDPNTIEVMVSRLRKKLSKGGVDNSIATIRGQGYKFNLPCS